MASPFPGMDPYLEAPSGWPGIHHRLISVLSDMLTERVSPHFFVAIEERVYIITPDEQVRQTIAPDIFLVRSPARGESRSTDRAITIPTLIEPLLDPDVHDRFIEIRDVASRELIATIEILSPYNKATATQGREAFVRKRRAVLASTSHWIEIDLLRQGERPSEVAGQSDYYALLKRGMPGPFEAWYADLRDRLPTIAVPLRDPFPDVPLDLQAAIETVYDRGAYQFILDYASAPPAPALPPADLQWVADRIAEWRSTSTNETPD